MSLSEIVQVSITTSTTGITRASFGIPLIASYHTVFAGRVETYNKVSDLVTAGFSVNSPTYKAAQALLSSTTKVTSFKVGRRLSAFTQNVDVTPTDDTEGLVYTITMTFPDGTAETATYTVQNADTIALIIDGLKTALDLLAGVIAYCTTTDQTTYLEIATDAAGDLVGYSAWNVELDFEDQTPDPGLAADLAAFRVADETFYGLVLDSNSAAEIAVAATWVAADDAALGGFNTADSEALNAASTTDIAYVLKAAARADSYLLFNRNTMGYAGAAWMGDRFPSDPGGSTWAFKTLSGISADILTASDRTALRGKNCNYYQEIAGRNVTYDGKAASGEYIDITRLVDWMVARIAEEVFLLLVNNPKLPYTDASVEIVKNAVYSVMLQAIGNGGIATDPVPIVTGPKVADVPTSQRAARILPDIEFEATVAGAIHQVIVSGVISV